MAIIKTTTTDNQGNTYKKVFSDFEQGAIVSTKGKNTKFAVRPNLSVRRGNGGKFGEEVVLQLAINEILETYTSKAGLDHLETYFKINEETIEFFEEFLKILKEEVKNNE